ncbi:MvaI/BcnI family restriction endonuclease [Clostridium perfringens]|uniref:MvaI/BcnI family restriction endonuclease n=1 Tax=Clostridium perfringens TaxID=1502 RepID=UPI001DFCC111|nr:MvaI/BcnI family restriction endonuclease [Clostridium perfringens]EHK2357602.1 hypothetical protein [Clostridium perfringens]MCX0383163.1 MvaI/BcnI family restriction endonuclease [Clostridium perfringens]
MSEHINELMKRINQIKGLGWIKSHRQGDTGIGKTFEDQLGVDENNIPTADFRDIEIKTHRQASSSMITLFTKAPSYPKGANTILRDNYGTITEHGTKKLHTTVSSTNPTNSLLYKFNFQVKIDDDDNVVRLFIYNNKGILINSDIFWSCSVFDDAIKKKLKTIAIIDAEEKVDKKGIHYFKYDKVKLVTGLTTNALKEAIRNGDVKIDIRIGTYNSGKNFGKVHDHGTGFRISLQNLIKYADIIQL